LGLSIQAKELFQLISQFTAGRLAELTGLTTGAITGSIDRLEKAKQK
jgi:DNA-binding MarR family transcriptional regulator